ncbi:TPA: hypothetical protein ACTL3K_004929, partial [Escherichia coli]
MARKEKFITIEGQGRDKGKVFHLTEMSASQAEWWAMRAIMAMGRGGVELPDDVRSLGMAALALEGLKALSKIPPDEARPLMDEMMDCVQFVPDPKKRSIRRPLVEEDIEEIITRLNLRAE